MTPIAQRIVSKETTWAIANNIQKEVLNLTSGLDLILDVIDSEVI